MSDVTQDREHDLYVAAKLPGIAERLREAGSESYSMAEDLEGLRVRLLRKWGALDEE